MTVPKAASVVVSTPFSDNNFIDEVFTDREGELRFPMVESVDLKSDDMLIATVDWLSDGCKLLSEVYAVERDVDEKGFGVINGNDVCIALDAASLYSEDFAIALEAVILF